MNLNLMEHQQFVEKLKTLMVARVLVATSILVSYYFFQSFYAVEASPLKWLVVLIIITYILTITYALLIGRLHNLKSFAYVQHIGDALIITSVLYITGGVTSPFAFLYTASIFSASIILYMRGALLIASFSSISYGLLITFQLYGIISPLGVYDIAEVEEKTLYRILINITGFYLLALLSGFLAEKVRKIDDELEANKLNLEKLQELHDNVIRSINIGLIISDQKGKLITVNDSAFELLGVSKRNVKAEQIADLLHSPEISDILAGLETKSELPLSKLESSITRSTGGEVMLEMNFSFWKSHEGIVNGLVILLRDITAEKELERSVKLHEKLAAIGELAAGLAHEIRNPLASMNGSVQMLRTDNISSSEQKEKLLSIIQREANRLDNIVTEFLNYAAPVAPRFREVYMKPFLEDFLELLKNDERFGDEIQIDLNVLNDICYPIDEQRIVQLLWNLALNSIESIAASKRKGIVVWQVEEKEETLLMSFLDNGIGISEEVNKKIFTPFYTTKGEGTGLGLAIIHSIVKEHNGEVTVNRNLHEGVEFRIMLNSRKS